MAAFEQLDRLQRDIEAKASFAPGASYTAQLLSKGVSVCAKKFGEEAVELALAAVQGKQAESTREAADVFYHLLVLLRATGISPAEVMEELKRREGTSGLTEKAARQP